MSGSYKEQIRGVISRKYMFGGRVDEGESRWIISSWTGKEYDREKTEEKTIQIREMK